MGGAARRLRSAVKARKYGLFSLFPVLRLKIFGLPRRCCPSLPCLGQSELYGPVPVKFVAAPAAMFPLKFVMLLIVGVNVNPVFVGLIV